MTWEAVSAIATLASAIIVAIAAIAAVVQIRHLRAGNQLTAILQIYDRFNSAEMTEARRYCLEDFPKLLEDPETLERMAVGSVEHRALLVGNFHNEIGSLVADGFLDDRLALPLVPLSARLWQVFAPLAHEIRKHRPDPVWADFEYIASLAADRVRMESHIARFPAPFRKRLRDELSRPSTSSS